MSRSASLAPIEVQVRLYDVQPGSLGAFVEEWRAQVGHGWSSFEASHDARPGNRFRRVRVDVDPRYSTNAITALTSVKRREPDS